MAKGNKRFNVVNWRSAVAAVEAASAIGGFALAPDTANAAATSGLATKAAVAHSTEGLAATLIHDFFHGRPNSRQSTTGEHNTETLSVTYKARSTVEKGAGKYILTGLFVKQHGRLSPNSLDFVQVSEWTGTDTTYFYGASKANNGRNWGVGISILTKIGEPYFDYSFATGDASSRTGTLPLTTAEFTPMSDQALTIEDDAARHATINLVTPPIPPQPL